MKFKFFGGGSLNGEIKEIDISNSSFKEYKITEQGPLIQFMQDGQKRSMFITYTYIYTLVGDAPLDDYWPFLLKETVTEYQPHLIG